MEQLFDMKTLLAANAALSIYVAAALLFYKINYKTYPGYTYWMVGAFLVAFAYIFLFLTGIISFWGILIAHGLIATALVLRLDGISRFTSDVKIAKKYYWLPVLYMIPIGYFSIVDDNAVWRNVLLGIFSSVLIMLIAMKFFRNTTPRNRNLYIGAGILLILYGLLIFAHALSWVINPQDTLLTSGRVHQLYFFLFMIFEVALGINILMMNNQRLERDLLISRDNLQEALQKLQAAMNEVKILGGLLPICSTCKKIRDDKGYWKQIESYIKEHSEAEFSHSICPDCLDKIYPELED